MSVSEEKDSTSGKIILLYQKNKIKLSINNKVIWEGGSKESDIYLSRFKHGFGQKVKVFSPVPLKKRVSGKAINKEIKSRTFSKSRLKKQISIVEGGKSEIFPKKNCFLLLANKLPSDTIKKENVIFLIVLQRSNFRYRVPQKFLGLWGMKVAHYIKIVHWASNSPRIKLE